jgi:hypothetical protein
MKTQFFIFHSAWNIFLKSMKNIVRRRIIKCGKFQIFPVKFQIEAQPVDQWRWIKFRGPILMVWSSLRNFIFIGLLSRSQPRYKVFSLEPRFEAIRKDPDPQKIPRAYFDLLNLCAKYQSHTSTGSTSNRGVKNPPKCMIWTSLIQ